MSSQNITQAQHLISQGLFDKARTILKSISKNNMHDANYWFLLGICNANLKKFHEAEKNFNKTVKLSPQAPQAWSNLGLSYLHQEKYSEAIRAFKKALTIDNNFHDAIYNLSVAYHKINKIDKAIKYAERAILINKNHFQSHNILGLCRQESDNVKSISSFRTAIKLNNHYYDAWHNLIDTYLLHKKNTEAEQTIKTAIRLFPRDVSLYESLGKLYESQNKHDKVISTYNEALEIDPYNHELLIGVARSYLARSEFDKCERILNNLLKTQPENINARIGKCNLLIRQRKYQHAYDLLSPIIKKEKNNPAIIIAYANICKLLNQADKAIDTLIDLTQKKQPKNIIELAGFTLADIYDQKHDYEKAFQYYKKSNNIFNDKTDIQYYRNSISSIIENIDRETLKSLPHSNNTSTAPVFIVGMPRSGTTLIEQILSSHPKVYGAGEITNLWSIGNQVSGAMNLCSYAQNLKNISQDEVNKYSIEYLQNIQNISNNSDRCTDKLPHNFFHIGLIALLFPNAKIIHCRRHPFDTCLSIYFKKFNDNHRYARNLTEIALFYKNYQLLMQHWSKNSQIKIYDAVYEDLITDPEKNIRALVQYVDIEWDDACLKHHESKRLIMTPSHNQASKPLYTSSINRWKNYSNHIQPLREILGDPEKYL